MKKTKSDSDIDFFKETFKLLNVEPRKFEYRLKTHPFDRPQKKLLEAFFFFKRNQKQEIFERLKGPSLDHPFLEATRRYLLGMSKNHYGQFRHAVEHLEVSIDLYSQLDEDEFIVYPLTSLVVTYGNMKDIKEMEKAVDQMNEYKARGDFSRLLMTHAEVLYLMKSGQRTKANKILRTVIEKNPPYLEMFLPSFLLMRFSAAFQIKRYDECSQILEDYKKSNGFIVKTNYLYMKSLLDHIAKAKPLYVYEAEFVDYPELHHQLEVIKALSRGDQPRALHYWSLLSKHNGKVYQDHFKFVADECLFSVGLKLYESHSVANSIDSSKIDVFLSPYEKLLFIFNHSKAPLSKAELIFLIWKEEVSEKSLNRLRKLVFDFNKRSEGKIISHQDTYQLAKAS